MRSLSPTERADVQLWGRGFLHTMNISDEVVTGTEGLGGAKADVWGVSTAMYKLRPLATLSPENALAVPSSLHPVSLELNRYHRDLWVNNLPDSHVVPVYGVHQFGYSGAIIRTFHSIKDHLNRIGVDRITAFIESENVRVARENMGFKEPVGVEVETVNSVNNKGYFLNAMAQIGVPTAFGRTLFTVDSVWECFREIRSMGAKTAYAKLSRAASGQGVFPISCDSTDDLEEFLALPQTQAQLSSIGVRLDYGIEGIVDSPNVMILVGEVPETDRFISASSQLLAKRNPSDARPTVHKWNISGLDKKTLDILVGYSQKVANWMRSIGAYGIVGLDYVITEKDEIFIMEANYRVNWGLAAAMKWHDLGSEFWAASGGIKVPKGTTLNQYVNHLQQNRIEYDGNSGVILLNPATSPAGTMQVGIYGNTKERIIEIMQWADMA